VAVRERERERETHKFRFINHVHQKSIKIQKNIILPVVLYGCETWSLTLMEEHRMRVFGNRVMWTEEE
jgi:hypothetical protein